MRTCPQKNVLCVLWPGSKLKRLFEVFPLWLLSGNSRKSQCQDAPLFAWPRTTVPSGNQLLSLRVEGLLSRLINSLERMRWPQSLFINCAVNISTTHTYKVLPFMFSHLISMEISGDSTILFLPLYQLVGLQSEFPKRKQPGAGGFSFETLAHFTPPHVGGYEVCFKGKPFSDGHFHCPAMPGKPYLRLTFT